MLFSGTEKQPKQKFLGGYATDVWADIQTDVPTQKFHPITGNAGKLFFAADVLGPNARMSTPEAVSEKLCAGKLRADFRCLQFPLIGVICIDFINLTLVWCSFALINSVQTRGTVQTYEFTRSVCKILF